MSYLTKIVESTEDYLENILRTGGAQLEWGDLNDEEVFDIGCGLGTSAIALLKVFPKIFSIYAIDKIEEILMEGSTRNMNEKIFYFQADITDLMTLNRWIRKVNRLICIDCFEWVQDHQQGFFNMYRLLQAGGSAIVVMNRDNPFRVCYDTFLEKSHFKDSGLTTALFPLFPTKKPTLQEYREMLEKIGFTIVHCGTFDRIYAFNNNSDFKRMATEFVSPLLAYLPKEQHEEFSTGFHTTFYEINGGFTEELNVKVKSNSLIFLLRKPPIVDV